MPNQIEIRDQQRRLTVHRRNLAKLLHQAADFGSETHATVEIFNLIREQREAIARIKHNLHLWGIAVEDHPDDKDPQDINNGNVPTTSKEPKQLVQKEERVYKIFGLPIWTVSVTVYQMLQAFIPLVGIAIVISLLGIIAATAVIQRPSPIAINTSIATLTLPVDNSTPTINPSRIATPNGISSTPTITFAEATFAPAAEEPTAAATPAAAIDETTTTALPSFSVQVLQNNPPSEDSGQRSSCVQGSVLDTSGNGISGAIIEANIGDQQSTRQATTNPSGAYSICGLPIGHPQWGWSIVLLFVPAPNNARENALSQQVFGNVLLNGSPDQIAIVNFQEQ